MSHQEHWSADGVTLLGLNALLLSKPPAQWASTYAELRRCGLGIAVVEWPEFSVGDAASGQRVVAAFLFVMSLDETRAALLKSGLATAALSLPGRLLPRSESGSVHQDLAERIAAQLADMSANSWPPCVLDLDEFEAAA